MVHASTSRPLCGLDGVVVRCDLPQLDTLFVLPWRPDPDPGDPLLHCCSYPDIELRPGGADVDVSESNLAEYIDAVVDATLGAGIRTQLQAFREGFNEVGTLPGLGFEVSADRGFVVKRSGAVEGLRRALGSRRAYLDAC